MKCEKIIFLKMQHFKIKFASETFEILPSGTIFWPSEEMLIASDLHLEKGSSFNKEGTFLPPYDSFDTITRLEEIIKITSPKKILLLGDTFHDNNGLLRMSEEVKKKIFSLLKKSSFILSVCFIELKSFLFIPITGRKLFKKRGC